MSGLHKIAHFINLLEEEALTCVTAIWSQSRESNARYRVLSTLFEASRHQRGQWECHRVFPIVQNSSCQQRMERAGVESGLPFGESSNLHHTKPIHLQVSALHQEYISFFILTSTRVPIILAFPWMHVHNPEKELISWSPNCHAKFLRTPQPYVPP